MDVLRHILLVDDDVLEYQLTKRKLPPGEFSLSWAADRQEAIKAAQQDEYDLVLLDYYLVQETGLDVLFDLNKRGIHTPVVMLTGLRNNDVDYECLRHGAKGFLSKDEMNTKNLKQVMRSAISQQNVEEHRLESITYDTLTKVYTKHMIMRKLSDFFDHSLRNQCPLSMGLCDVDHISQINQEHGEKKGDEVLTKVADILKDETRQCDFVGRISDDQFLLLFPYTKAMNAAICLERIRQRVARHCFFSEGQWRTVSFNATVSCGAAEYNPDMFGWENLVEEARYSLNVAKLQGGSVVEFV